MIDYATNRRVHHLHEVNKLTLTQIGQQLALHPQTVRYWLDWPTPCTSGRWATSTSKTCWKAGTD